MELVLKEKAFFNNGELLEIKFHLVDGSGSLVGEASLYRDREGAQSFAKRVMMEANLKVKKANEKAQVQDASPTPPSQ